MARNQAFGVWKRTEVWKMTGRKELLAVVLRPREIHNLSLSIPSAFLAWE